MPHVARFAGAILEEMGVGMRTDSKQFVTPAAGARRAAAAWPSACMFNQAAGRVRPSYLTAGIGPVVTQGHLWEPEGVLGKDNQIQQ